MSEIVPVILCGGAGSRLWPLSEKFAETIRLSAWHAKSFSAALGRIKCCEFAKPVVVTSSDHRFLVEKQMHECGRVGDILLEPEGKNTAPAVFATASRSE